MKLRPDVSLAAFLQAVSQCTGEVVYKTDEGDILNLKSQLSKYLFLAVISADKDVPITGGSIVCDVPMDYKALEEYLISKE